MLHLPEQTSSRLHLISSSLAVCDPCRRAVPDPHQATAMIEWFGPIIQEYYAGSEGIGFTAIDSEAWLSHPGSVGRPAGTAVHIVGDDGT